MLGSLRFEMVSLLAEKNYGNCIEWKSAKSDRKVDDVRE